MLFRFALRPLEQVVPWGEPGDQKLHWFGLTDGWSWIDVGSAELFRYTPGAMAHFGLPRDDPFVCYPDYFVIRLMEDVRDLLPDALEPVPADVLADVSVAELASERLFGPDDATGADDDLCRTAAAWWWARQLPTNHLRLWPRIRLFRAYDTVHVGWDNRDRTVDGVPVWTADVGHVTFPVAEFVGQVRGFHDRLAAAMRPRVDHLRRAGPPAGVDIHMPSLVDTQAAWDAGMADPFARLTRTDWNRVRAALAEVRRRWA